MHTTTAIDRALCAPPLSTLAIRAELRVQPWVGGKGRELRLGLRDETPRGDLATFHHIYMLSSMGGKQIIDIGPASHGMLHI